MNEKELEELEAIADRLAATSDYEANMLASVIYAALTAWGANTLPLLGYEVNKFMMWQRQYLVKRGITVGDEP